MTNLLEETLSVMEKLGKSEYEVTWVGSKDGRYMVTWSQFKEMAKDYFYMSYCYSEKITPVPEDLVVVFAGDSWLSRGWSDGYIYWVYNELPKMRFDHRKDFLKLPLGRSRLSEGS